MKYHISFEEVFLEFIIRLDRAYYNLLMKPPLKYEIEKAGLFVQGQLSLPMYYEEITVDVGYKLDLLVEKKVVVELKSVELL